MSDPKSLEELHKELMDWAGMSPPTASKPSQTGFQPMQYGLDPGEWSITEYGKMVDLTPEPPVGSTQRVIPDRCQYAKGMLIPGAPTPPMSPRTAEDHPDMLEAAQRKIRRFVATTYRNWPACNCSNRNVEIDFQYDFDNSAGAVLVGFFQCGECSR